MTIYFHDLQLILKIILDFNLNFHYFNCENQKMFKMSLIFNILFYHFLKLIIPLFYQITIKVFHSKFIKDYFLFLHYNFLHLR